VSAQEDLDAYAGMHCTIADEVFISADDIESLHGLEGLESIDDSLWISGDKLRSIEALSTLTFLPDTTITDAPQLASLRGLDAVAQIFGQLLVWNTGIENLEALGALYMVQNLYVSHNPNLRSLDGLSARISSQDNSITLSGNPQLASITPLIDLEQIHDLSISDTALEALSDLRNLRSAAGLTISLNSKLTSTSGLEQLRFVENYLTLYKNESLTDLTGLDRIVEVAKVQIRENPKLETLGPLARWPSGTVTTEISIGDNPTLPSCEVEAFYATHDLRRDCRECTGNGDGSCD
jgi:hypothetical protein